VITRTSRCSESKIQSRTVAIRLAAVIHPEILTMYMNTWRDPCSNVGSPLYSGDVREDKSTDSKARGVCQDINA
jgi:hypothetical protein